MNKILSILIILITSLSFISCHKALDKEIIFFEGINFDSGNYKILIYGLEGEIIESYRDFYIDDISALNEIKKQWVFTKQSETFACGYSYNLRLVNQTEILKNEAINIECEYMSKWIIFPKII